jgi:hypothetical protein
MAWAGSAGCFARERSLIEKWRMKPCGMNYSDAVPFPETLLHIFHQKLVA